MKCNMDVADRVTRMLVLLLLVTLYYSKVIDGTLAFDSGRYPGYLYCPE